MIDSIPEIVDSYDQLPPDEVERGRILADSKHAINNKGLLWTIKRKQMQAGRNVFEGVEIELNKGKFLAYKELLSTLKMNAMAYEKEPKKETES
jgi:hypothetical protein